MDTQNTDSFCHSLGNGLKLSLREHIASERGQLRILAPRGRVGCSFCLEGSMVTHMTNPTATNQVPQGVSGIWHAPGMVVLVDVEPGIFRWLDLEMELDRLMDCLGSDLDAVRPAFRDSLQHPGRPFRDAGFMSPATRSLVGEMISSPFTGALGKLHLESLGLSLMLGELKRHAMAPAACASTVSALGRQLEQAREYLLADLSDPPSISALARQVHMSESSLKRAFRKAYGMSIFSFFRAHRLEHAKSLLSRGEMNVTEVAFCVGYSNHSHFSRAFKRHFGISPKSCLASIHPISHQQPATTGGNTHMV